MHHWLGMTEDSRKLPTRVFDAHWFGTDPSTWLCNVGDQNVKNRLGHKSNVLTQK